MSDLIVYKVNRSTNAGNVASGTSSMPPSCSELPPPHSGSAIIWIGDGQSYCVTPSALYSAGLAAARAGGGEIIFRGDEVTLTTMLIEPKVFTPPGQKVVTPPGHLMGSLAALLFSPKHCELRFRPIIDDLRLEYNEACIGGAGKWRRGWIRLRYAPAFIDAFCNITGLVRFIRWLISVWPST